MSYPDAVWERAMTVQEVILKAQRYQGFNVRHFHQVAIQLRV